MGKIAFAKVSGRVQLLGLPAGCMRIVLADDDNLGTWKFPTKHPHRFKPVHLGHRDIHEHYIGAKNPGFLNGFDIIHGFTDDPIGF